jgi:hypothetical protein
METYLMPKQDEERNVLTAMANFKKLMQDLDNHTVILLNQDVDRFANCCKGYMEA